MMKKTKIKLVSNDKFETRSIYGVDHLYYQFNKKEYAREVLLFLNLHEHYNNLELLKFALMCKRYSTKITVYTNINEFPLVSTFADAAILYPGKTDEVYRHITRYEHDRKIVGKLFDQFVSSPHGLHDAIGLSRTQKENWPLLLEIAEDQISDEEVVEKFSFPEIHIRESAYIKYKQIKNQLKENAIVCEVKVSEQKPLGYDTGENFLSSLERNTKDFALEIIKDKSENAWLANICGHDYMGVQIICSFLKNWMWICYGGSCNIFPFFPVKILSMTDQTICESLTRKMSIERFGEIGKVFPEFQSLIYCMPDEKDGTSRTDGLDPLPNLKSLTVNFSKLKINWEIKSLEDVQETY